MWLGRRRRLVGTEMRKILIADMGMGMGLSVWRCRSLHNLDGSVAKDMSDVIAISLDPSLSTILLPVLQDLESLSTGRLSYTINDGDPVLSKELFLPCRCLRGTGR